MIFCKKLPTLNNDELLDEYIKSIRGKIPLKPDIFEKLFKRRGMNINIDYLIEVHPEKII